MRRRRKRPVVQWLPQTGTLRDGSLPAVDQSSGFFFKGNAAFGPGNPTTVIEVPLVLDNPPDALTFSSISFLDHQAKALDDDTVIGYRLRRIVGTIAIVLTKDVDTAGSAPTVVLVNAGLMVRRVNPEGVSLADLAGVSAIDPGSLANIQDPWIWRRTWFLTPIRTLLTAGSSTLQPVPSGSDALSTLAGLIPQTNAFNTGVNNTASIDQKTARRIGPEERLFLDVAFTVLGFETQQAFSVSTDFFIGMDYRVLASMGRWQSNRRNASR